VKSKKEIDKDYYQSHRIEVLQQVSEYYKRNKRKISAYKKKWWKERMVKIPITGEIENEKVRYF